MSIQDNSRNTGYPDSIAMIMDGNGRWAKKRGLPRTEGHAAGAKTVEMVLAHVRELGIHHLTLYAFSTENWKRPEDEVKGLMSLFYRYITKIAIPKIKSDPELGIKFIGDKARLSERLRKKCLEAEALSEGKSYICNIALNYGGRAEIVNAANRAIKDGHTELTEQILSRYMYTSHSPDPDLIIRTGGEFRISNFLLWQGAYSEYVILDKLWPDLTKEDIDECVAKFKSRERRFGGVGT